MSSRKTAGRHAASFHTADPGRDYEFVLDLRETADDGGVAEAFLASARKAIEKARAILAALKTLLPNDAPGNA
jgi:hypothetical protein